MEVCLWSALSAQEGFTGENILASRPNRNSIATIVWLGFDQFQAHVRRCPPGPSVPAASFGTSFICSAESPSQMDCCRGGGFSSSGFAVRFGWKNGLICQLPAAFVDTSYGVAAIQRQRPAAIGAPRKRVEGKKKRRDLAGSADGYIPPCARVPTVVQCGDLLMPQISVPDLSTVFVGRTIGQECALRKPCIRKTRLSLRLLFLLVSYCLVSTVHKSCF